MVVPTACSKLDENVGQASETSPHSVTASAQEQQQPPLPPPPPIHPQRTQWPLQQQSVEMAPMPPTGPPAATASSTAAPTAAAAASLPACAFSTEPLLRQPEMDRDRDGSRLMMELEIDRARIVDVSGAPCTLNTYVVCRLCPLIPAGGGGAHGSASSTTTRGTVEGDVVRTQVCWGASMPNYLFRHSAPLIPEVAHDGAQPAAAAHDGAPSYAHAALSGGSSSTAAHDGARSSARGGARGTPREIVLEIWAIADDTMAETLVGLVRALVRVPPAAALQRYATSVIDGSRAIVNPFDITSRGKLTAGPASLASTPSMQALTTAPCPFPTGELTVRLRLGTAAQLRAALQLRLAISTIQVHADCD